MQAQEDKARELQVFYDELVEFDSLVQKYLADKRLQRIEGTKAASLQTAIARKVGYLAHLIAELSGIATIDLDDREYDMWLIALKDPPTRYNAKALGLCIQACNRAIGKLEDDIRTGKRDRKTGELVAKSVVSGSEPPAVSTAQAGWKAIYGEFGMTKRAFGKRISFVSDDFRRSIIFRDVEHAALLASSGFSKPAAILAGGVIEELLRLFLEHKGVSPISHDFDGYIAACQGPGFLKSGTSHLSTSVRHFRNLVHLSKEETRRQTVSKATAKGAVSSIFTIANDLWGQL